VNGIKKCFVPAVNGLPDSSVDGGQKGALPIYGDGKEFNILCKDVKKANLEYDFNKKQ